MLLIKQSFQMEGFMVWAHDLQESFDVRLFLGNCEVVKTEIVLVSLYYYLKVLSSSKLDYPPSLSPRSTSRLLSLSRLHKRQISSAIAKEHWLDVWRVVFCSPIPSKMGQEFLQRSNMRLGEWFYGIWITKIVTFRIGIRFGLSRVVFKVIVQRWNKRSIVFVLFIGLRYFYYLPDIKISWLR